MYDKIHYKFKKKKKKRIGKRLPLSVLSQKQSQLRFNIHRMLVRYSEPLGQGSLFCWAGNQPLSSNRISHSFPFEPRCLLTLGPGPKPEKTAGVSRHAQATTRRSWPRSSFRSRRWLYKSQLYQLKHRGVREASFHFSGAFTGWNTDASAPRGPLRGPWCLPPVYLCMFLLSRASI